MGFIMTYIGGSGPETHFIAFNALRKLGGPPFYPACEFTSIEHSEGSPTESEEWLVRVFRETKEKTTHADPTEILTGALEGLEKHLKRKMDAAIVHKEVDQLRQWKESAMAVSSSWDVQAVGKALEVRLGSMIHPQILPGIEKLKDENLRLAAQIVAGDREFLRVEAELVALKAENEDLKGVLETIISTAGKIGSGPLWHGSEEIEKARELMIRLSKEE